MKEYTKFMADRVKTMKGSAIREMFKRMADPFIVFTLSAINFVYSFILKLLSIFYLLIFFQESLSATVLLSTGFSGVESLSTQK